MSRKKILVIAPHPDDEVLGCGASLRRWADEGHETHIAIVTRGWPPLFAETQVEQVRAEARAAAARLGVQHLHFLDLPVTKLALMGEHELNGAMNRLIEEARPNWALLPFRNDVHEDHRQVYDAAIVALRPLAHRAFIERILCYETLSETHWGGVGIEQQFLPQVFVDVSATLPAKLDAMRCYVSQLRPAPDARSIESLEALARFRGMTVNCHAAEAFMLVRDVSRAET